MTISQANNATNDSTAALLTLTQSDIASTGDVLVVTQSTTGIANAIDVSTSSTTVAVTISAPAAELANQYLV